MTITNEELLDRTRRVLSARPRRNATPLVLDSTFAEIGLDSLDALSLMFDLETEFGVTLPDGVAFHAATLRDVLQLVRVSIETPVPSEARLSAGK